MRTRVVAVTGAPGVGKTTVGALLARRLPGPTVTIDTDALAAVWPWEENDALLDLMAENLLTLLPRARAWGARTVVVSGVLLPGRLVPRLAPLLDHPDLDWGWYALRARPETLARRVAGFDGVHDPELRVSMSRLDTRLDDLAVAVQISTDDLTVDDVVERVVAAEAARDEVAVAAPPPPVRTPTAVLRAWAERALVSRAVPADDAAALVGRLIDADADGAPSHGLVRVGEYVDAIDSGEVVAGAQPVVERAGGSLLVSGGGAGGWATAAVVARLLAEASAPVEIVRVSQGGHLGRLGDLVRPAARAGRIVLGLATFGGTGQKVAAAGTAVGTLATNPVVLGFPAHDRPVVVDVSTSTWSEGAVRVAALLGEALPAGVLVRPDGRPSFDPASLYAADPAARAALTGLGRTSDGRDDHKGFALGLVVELLGGAAGGGLVCASTAPDGRGGNSALFVSIAPAHLGHTEAALGEMVARLEAHVTVREALDPARPPRLPGRGAAVAVPDTLELPAAVVKRLRRMSAGPAG